ncbi:protein of unknown function [uncultured Woeseiaceae bacterium]|uniref:Uncharacterized protein n=1 Tax=uncultured Woeseiaceae bacterium TaxID=1983305 RepID=A0A7D9H856_9GAMM|nr:protein of unknown function [uncultured Woeseiaceae bacterium]
MNLPVLKYYPHTIFSIYTIIDMSID